MASEFVSPSHGEVVLLADGRRAYVVDGERLFADEGRFPSWPRPVVGVESVRVSFLDEPGSVVLSGDEFVAARDRQRAERALVPSLEEWLAARATPAEEVAA